MLRAVATDGHRLAQAQLDAPDGTKGMTGVIVPRKTVGEIQKLVEDPDAEIEVEISDTKIRVHRSALVVLTSKLIDGTFPDYVRVIPQGNDKVMKVDKGGVRRRRRPRLDHLQRARPRGQDGAQRRQDGALGQQPRFGQRDRGARRRLCRSTRSRSASTRSYLLDVAQPARERHRRVPLRRPRLADPHPGRRRRRTRSTS